MSFVFEMCPDLLFLICLLFGRTCNDPHPTLATREHLPISRLGGFSSGRRETPRWWRHIRCWSQVFSVLSRRHLLGKLPLPNITFCSLTPWNQYSLCITKARLCPQFCTGGALPPFSLPAVSNLSFLFRVLLHVGVALMGPLFLYSVV